MRIGHTGGHRARVVDEDLCAPHEIDGLPDRAYELPQPLRSAVFTTGFMGPSDRESCRSRRSNGSPNSSKRMRTEAPVVKFSPPDGEFALGHPPILRVSADGIRFAHVT